MEITTHGLVKPGQDDYYNVDNFNRNTDLLEQHMSDNGIHVDAQAIAGFAEAEKLAQINASDTNETLWGKLKKLITDFQAHIGVMATLSELGHIKITEGNGLKNNDGMLGMDRANGAAYGSVKLSDTYASAVNGGNAAGGIGASQSALYNVYNLLNANLMAIDDWIDITTQCNWGNVRVDTTEAYRSWLRYNPRLRLLKGAIHTPSTINNQERIVRIPYIEGVGSIPFIGLCGMGYTKDATMIIMPRINGNNEIFSSHSEDKSAVGASYIIDLAY